MRCHLLCLKDMCAQKQLGHDLDKNPYTVPSAMRFRIQLPIRMILFRNLRYLFIVSTNGTLLPKTDKLIWDLMHSHTEGIVPYVRLKRVDSLIYEETVRYLVRDPSIFFKYQEIFPVFCDRKVKVPLSAFYLKCHFCSCQKGGKE